MSAPYGQFIWYELITPSLEAQQRFYSAVTGWRAKDFGQSAMRYLVLHPPGSSDDRGVAGMMEMTPEMGSAGMPVAWRGYVWVDDVDAYAARVEKLGGKIHKAPENIPGVGRFAMVTDPQDAAFQLFRPDGQTGPTPPPDITPGHVGWRELITSDWQAAFAFYSELFGWAKVRSVDMGAAGTYQVWSTPSGQMGGMMNRFDASARPAWGYYISVAGVLPAAEKIKASGGRLSSGPHEVPGGGWIANATDPSGTPFAITGPKG